MSSPLGNSLQATHYPQTPFSIRKWLHNNPIVTNATVAALGILGLRTLYSQRCFPLRRRIRQQDEKIHCDPDLQDSRRRLHHVLHGPEVNNIRTVSAAYLDPKKRSFAIAFDNGYAADRPLLQIPTHQWLLRNSEGS